MAFSHSKTARVLAGGFDLSDTTRKVDGEGQSELLDTTAFQSTAKRFITGFKTGKVSMSGLWSGTADGRLAAISSDISDVNYGAGTLCFTHYPAGDTVGNRGWAMLCTETQWAYDSPAEDVVTYSLEAQSSVGREPIISHFAIGAADNLPYYASGTATAVDNAAASTNGGAGYFHNFQLSAGTASVKIQHSTNNSTWSDLVTFANVTTASPRTSERISIAGTINRYTRAVYTITGGTASFHTGLARL